MEIGLNRIRAISALAMALATASANAQEWPRKPIRLVVPYPPGGGTDAVLRVILPKMSTALGQTIYIDNKGGANTIIGTDLVAKANPDGYTFGLITDSHSINPNFQKLPYDSAQDFQPVSQLVFVPFALVTKSGSEIDSVATLVKLAKSKPGRLSYASLGEGSPHYLAMEWFRYLAGLNINHIPYRGTGPALVDILGGQVDLMFNGVSTVIPQVKDGRAIALAVSSPKRQSQLPEVPTVAESGFPEFEFRTWYGVVAPANTPVAIVSRMSTEIKAALQSSEVLARFGDLGVEPAPSTPQQFSEFMKDDARKYANIIKLTNAKAGGKN